MLRAYDKKTGAEVGAVFMPAPQSGSPMTYMVDGSQYIVVAVSGGNYSGEYIAFSLPDFGSAADRTAVGFSGSWVLTCQVSAPVAEPRSVNRGEASA